MADPVYLCKEPWHGERPETLVISCVDGRWRPYIQEFLAEGLATSPRTDIMAVPGGVEPLTLVDLIPKDFSFFRRRIEGLVEAHGTRRVICIGHQDCAWYAARKIGPITINLQDRQLKDLRRAAAWIRETFPNLRVEAYFARRLAVAGEPEKVVFEAV
jgi:hypothetical protein